MAQTGFTPILIYGSSTPGAVPSAGNLATTSSGVELGVNAADGKLFYKDTGGVVRVLATTAGSAGDVVGPASSTDNALVRFDSTTGKLVQSSVGILSDTGDMTGLNSITLATALAITSGGTGATTASGARTNFGATTLGSNLFTLANPGAVTFPRFNADNTVSALSAADFRAAIGAGSGGGSVTSVSGTGSVNGLTLSGTVTSSGNITLGGTLSGVSLTTQVTGTLPVANGGTGSTTSTGSGAVVLATGPTISGPESTGAIYDNGSVRGNLTAVAALDIDCTAGNFFTKTISANSTFTFSNPPSSRAYAFTLELTHTSGTVTWPAAVQWPGGTAPSLTNAKTSLFVFVTDDGGTRWRGVANTNYTT